MGKAALFTGLIVAMGAVSLALTSCLGTRATEMAITACAPIDKPGSPFPSVSEVMERRCGTLDCHGQPSRPLRIYSSIGLRLPEPSQPCPKDGKKCPGDPQRTCLKGVGCVDASITDYGQYYSGGSITTTPSERLANWESMCGLEPEVTTIVYCCTTERCTPFDYEANCPDGEKFDPSRLTLVRKARLTEKHKGGKVFPIGSDGDQCITKWMKGDYDVKKKDEVVKAPDCEAELQKL
jgi:hypothetical protein